MLKKLAALAGAGALLLGTAIPVFAFDNIAIIKGNDATATANTGDNLQVGNGVYVEKAGVGGNISVSGNNTMTTGNAKAKAKLVIVANSNICGDCGGSGGGLAVVKWNDATADANSGGNGQGGNVADVYKAHVDGNISVSGNNSMTTGEAKAKAKVWIVVNVNWGL